MKIEGKWMVMEIIILSVIVDLERRMSLCFFLFIGVSFELLDLCVFGIVI